MSPREPWSARYASHKVEVPYPGSPPQVLVHETLGSDAWTQHIGRSVVVKLTRTDLEQMLRSLDEAEQRRGR
jgi:hypothetical protein